MRVGTIPAPSRQWLNWVRPSIAWGRGSALTKLKPRTQRKFDVYNLFGRYVPATEPRTVSRSFTHRF
jgi:hypothetical protein